MKVDGNVLVIIRNLKIIKKPKKLGSLAKVPMFLRNSFYYVFKAIVCFKEPFNHP